MTASVLQEGQASDGTGTALNSIGVTVTGITSGSYIHVLTECGGASTTTFTDSNSDTPGSFGTFLDSAHSGSQMTHGYFGPVLSGSITFTAHFATAEGFCQVWAKEIGGVSGVQASNIASAATVSATVSTQPALWSGLGFATDLSGAPTATSGTTGINGWDYSPSGFPNLATSSSARVTSTGSVTASYSGPTTAVSYIGIFTESSGGGTSGSAAITEGADTVSAAGKTTIVGTAAITEGADTVAASGKTTIVGTAAITEGTDTVAASGTTTATGTAAITEGADSVTASGVTTIVGTAAITEGADTVTASGTSGSSVVGTAAILEGSDTVNASGTTTIVATAAIVEGSDAVTASGTTTIVGMAAIVEGGDIVVASGIVGSVTGTAAIAEGADTVSASGQSGSGSTPAGKHRKRYGIMDGWKLLLFDTKADADAYRTSLRKDIPAKKLKRIKTVEPAQIINVPELKRDLPAPLATKLDQLIRNHQYGEIEAFAAERQAHLEQEAVKAKEEQEEVEMVAHVVHAHRQASAEHIQAIHKALKVLHEIRRLRSIR